MTSDLSVDRVEIVLKIYDMAKERGLTEQEILHILLHEAYHLQNNMRLGGEPYDGPRT